MYLTSIVPALPRAIWEGRRQMAMISLRQEMSRKIYTCQQKMLAVPNGGVKSFSGG
jgi:hypothetical protein